MLTVVLDDDPTGTQSATDVAVLLDWTADEVVEVLRSEGVVYLQTNSRAIDETAAVQLARGIKEQLAYAATSLGERVLVVLRGDSTLRGHVFAESDVFAAGVAPVLFVPAFPEGGRTTIGSVHRVLIGGRHVPVGETEFARDPVFGFVSSNLVEFVHEKGGRVARPVSLSALRESGGLAVAVALRASTGGEFVVPDVETDQDIALVQRGLMDVVEEGRDVVVRCGAPLAAACAGRHSSSYLYRPLAVTPGPVLFVCGSHTMAATRQIELLSSSISCDPVFISTESALSGQAAVDDATARELVRALKERGVAILATERNRRESAGTLTDGRLVMDALMAATEIGLSIAPTVVSKGGITSAEVARTALGWRRARVRGQIYPGISVWDAPPGGGGHVQVVVPGNVGGPSTLVDVCAAIAPALLSEQPEILIGTPSSPERWL